MELSRRRLLAGLGTVGVASAGAGLGTSAYFSDREEFDGNTLVAGELDMKVSYEEHYSDWSDDELDGINESDVTMTQPDDLANWTGITGDQVGPVWVRNENASTFMNNTEIVNTSAPKPLELPAEPCSPPGETENDDPAANINIGDVKPGDFGEVTFDFYLCGNPGYVWMYGDLVDLSENGKTEPEMEDPDETSDPDPSGLSDDYVELADEIQTAIWRDRDCDNVPDLEPEPYCMDLIIDTSGSMELEVYADGDPTIIKKEAANEIGRGIVEGLDDIDGDDGDIGPGNSLAAVNSFDDDTTNLQDLTGNESDLLAAVDQAEQNTPADETDVPLALESAIDTLEDCPHDRRFAVLVTNAPSLDSETRAAIEDAAARLKGTATGGGVSYDPGTGQKTTGSDVLTPGATLKIVALDVDEGSSEEAFWQGVASNMTEVFTVQQDPNVGAPSNDDNVRNEMQAATNGVVSQVALGGGNEEMLFTGTLRNFLQNLSGNQNNGIPIPGDIPAADGGGTGRNCYSAETRHCVGFAWWLPVDHANEIQTDSVEFDLGFYTEQCRHNDGSGINNTNTSQSPP